MDSNVCYGKDAPGLNEYCFNTGFDHAALLESDPLGEAIGVAPCTTNERANKCYGEGYVAGMPKISKEMAQLSNYENAERNFFKNNFEMSVDCPNEKSMTTFSVKPHTSSTNGKIVHAVDFSANQKFEYNDIELSMSVHHLVRSKVNSATVFGGSISKNINTSSKIGMSAYASSNGRKGFSFKYGINL